MIHEIYAEYSFFHSVGDHENESKYILYIFIFCGKASCVKKKSNHRQELDQIFFIY